jgi:hypothetical protein
MLIGKPGRSGVFAGKSTPSVGEMANKVGVIYVSPPQNIGNPVPRSCEP